MHVLISLKPDETIAVVPRGESFMFLPLVLKDALSEVARHSDVKRVTAAGHDVSKVGVFMRLVIVDGPCGMGM